MLKVHCGGRGNDGFLKMKVGKLKKQEMNNELKLYFEIFFHCALISLIVIIRIILHLTIC